MLDNILLLLGFYEAIRLVDKKYSWKSNFDLTILAFRPYFYVISIVPLAMVYLMTMYHVHKLLDLEHKLIAGLPGSVVLPYVFIPPIIVFAVLSLRWVFSRHEEIEFIKFMEEEYKGDTDEKHTNKK